MIRLLVVGCWLLVVGCWLFGCLVVGLLGCWLLGVGCWVVVLLCCCVGCWLSVKAVFTRRSFNKSSEKGSKLFPSNP